ncbi:PH domain-containing protein [Frondihabitans sp. VKM Ac-2883]|uniref:PH domain-containing protein n=1 Tax=Frondihabitans sp. VKM Ac-2883 TaxID=2783823 RepID=UPI00351C689D
MPANALARSRVSSLIAAAVFIAVSSLPVIIGNETVARIVALVDVAISLFALLELIWFEPIRQRSFFLEVNDRVITISQGRIFRHMRLVPIDRVTVVKTRSGPFSRLYDHVDASIVATTLDIRLPPLSRASFDAMVPLLSREP